MSTTAPPPPLGQSIRGAALAFRGYNLTNLGRTPELLAHPAYHAIIVEELRRYSDLCAEATGTSVDLAAAVRQRLEFGLQRYTEAVALVVAVESAQLRLLHEVHGIDFRQAKLAFGYSLGEIMAVACSGAIGAEDLVRVPLELARDCAELAHDATLAIVFSRGRAIAESEMRRLCAEVTAEGRGTIGVSSVLSPNSYLVVGQGETTSRFKAAIEHAIPGVHVRPNDGRWPPLHTPIVRQRCVPDRAAVRLETLPVGPMAPQPGIVSLVTGRRDYDPVTVRETLRNWVDHPQRLWDAVCETLAADCKLVLHVGPEPNVIPATFTRLATDVRQQTGGRTWESYGKRAISSLARRPWLAAVLPARTALLRAPFVQQINLEDWLLDHAPGA